MATATSISTSNALSSALAYSTDDRSALRASAMSDDDDEIVYPISSQSTTPVLVEDSGAGSFHKDNNNNTEDQTNIHGSGQDDDHYKADPFVLERGDAGSKVWTPPPPRPRGRGHRSTKSESSLPVPRLYETEATLEPLKESWADDTKGLEKQMARASLAETTDRPRSTAGTGDAHVPRRSRSAPRKQRSQKKQKGGQQPRAAPARVGTRSVPNKLSNAAQSYPSPAATPSPTKSTVSGKAVVPNSAAPSPTKKKAKKAKSNNKERKLPPQDQVISTAPSTPRGFGTRSIVDDVSENGDAMLPAQSLIEHQSGANLLMGVAYDEAVKFMNAFIEQPDYYTSKASRLTFLQALIVELGLVSTTGPEPVLPESLTAAKALLKTHAFLNVRDYLALREKGLDALRSAMRPSRSALVRELRGRNGRRAKVGWIKETGLSVLLVSCQ